jgi:predicted transposase YbfD/YdcC
MQGGKAGEDSHRKFNAGWKTGRPWLDFRQVATTTTDLDSAGNYVLVTAMFCKMAGFKHNNRGKPAVWTDAGGGCQRAKLESVKDHEGTSTHKEAANLQMNQSDMKEAVKTAILQHDHVLLNLQASSCPWPRTTTHLLLSNWWTHSLLREGYGKDKHWVLLGLPSRDSA